MIGFLEVSKLRIGKLILGFKLTQKFVSAQDKDI